MFRHCVMDDYIVSVFFLCLYRLFDMLSKPNQYQQYRDCLLH